ncbi:hypothetical protein M758_10G039300 [Ceratodon purpureus]|nr:hypothetical protein M758_10G039300 [Ceratodon purpureus]
MDRKLFSLLFSLLASPPRASSLALFLSRSGSPSLSLSPAQTSSTNVLIRPGSPLPRLTRLAWRLRAG